MTTKEVKIDVNGKPHSLSMLIPIEIHDSDDADEIRSHVLRELRKSYEPMFDKVKDFKVHLPGGLVTWDSRMEILSPNSPNLRFDDSVSVNHPNHYGGEDNPYEAIKVIEAWELGFNLGNTVKYISRAGKKESKVVDLKKAKWYLEREISKIESDKLFE